MIATTILLGLLTVAAVTDFREQKIYNWTTYPGMLAGLALNAAGSVAENWDVDLHRVLGYVEFWDSLTGLLVCGLFMVVCFVFFPISGGDVKLVAMVGAWLGLQRGLEAMLWTFVLGACLGIIILIWRDGAWNLVSMIGRQTLYMMRVRGPLPLADEDRRRLQFPLLLAPTALAAAVIVRFHLVEFL